MLHATERRKGCPIMDMSVPSAQVLPNNGHIKICTFSLYCYMTKSQPCHFLAFELKKVEKSASFCTISQCTNTLRLR
jgi:hypothetical protein